MQILNRLTPEILDSLLCEIPSEIRYVRRFVVAATVVVTVAGFVNFVVSRKVPRGLAELLEVSRNSTRMLSQAVARGLG